ncbi:MAG: thiamine pyrophosphate-binding protein [Desulfobacterales bacterium]|nr:thiamine pyrophosphate-binding protein [Desulfobacterales bacterium]
MPTVAERFVERLIDHDVRHAFGIPGGPWIPYMEAMRRRGLPFTVVANEASAGFMADVCYRLTGRPALCHGTFGPGATNLATGVGCAWLDRSALIAATTEPTDAMRRRVMQMNIDHQALFTPLTKHTVRAGSDDIDAIVDRAVLTACEEVPGPVHIGLPSDLAEQPAKAGTAAPPTRPLRPALPAAETLSAAAETIGAARRPLLAVGLTALRLGLGSRVRRLAESLQAPVVLTPMAKGLVPEDHPLYAGVLFHARSDLLADIIREADLVVGIGYDPVEFNYEAWLPDAPLVHLDTRPADVAAEIELAVDGAGDLAAALAFLDEAPFSAKDWDLTRLADHRQTLYAALRPAGDTDLSPSEALEVLRNVLPPEGIMTCDVGAHTHLVGQVWPTPAPGRQLMTNGWSSMGFALPAALAAAICRPEIPVVGVTGDGGFTMMAGELITARRLGLDCVILVLADRMLSLIEVKQGWKACDPATSVLYDRGFIDADRIFGVPVLTAETPEGLAHALESAFRTAGPVVVEVVVDGAAYHQLIARSYR